MEPFNEFTPPQPAILIGWNADHKGVNLHIDFNQLKNWDFAVAVLEMAQDALGHGADEIEDGEGKPAIAVGWDDAEQWANVGVNNRQLPGTGMPHALLGMAKRLAEFNANMSRAAQIQNAQMAAAQSQAIQQRISKGNILRGMG